LTLQPFEFLIAIKLVHVRDASHANLFALRTIHLAESIVEFSRTQKKTRMGEVSALKTSTETVASNFALYSLVCQIRLHAIAVAQKNGATFVVQFPPKNSKLLKE